MKHTAVFILYTIMTVSTTYSRPVKVHYKTSELWEKADLVAVIQPQKTVKTQDQLTHAGPKYGPRNPDNYQGLNTEFKIESILKQSNTNNSNSETGLTILHFAYSAKAIEFNGAFFIYFHTQPTKFVTQAVQDGKTLHKGLNENGVTGESPTYLAFLRKRKDERFEPVTGNYDAAPSFRILTIPLTGQMSFAIYGIPK